MNTDKKKRIVVIGGGFAGLELIKKLKHSPAYEVILVDLNNYNFFPPLLYQVASGFMEPSAISYPFRKILRGKENVRFRLGALQQVIPEENRVELSNGSLTYDILVMATGTETNFFGNENVQKWSLPMKTIGDALALRNLVFTRLERATRVEDPLHRKKLLSFVIAGAGPTGVELSGILAEMRKNILRKDYPELKKEDLGDIYLLDGQDSVLATMSDKTQHYTKKKLEGLGVIVKLDTLVQDFKEDTVYLSDGTTLASKNLIWAAGVSAKVFDGFKKEDYGRGRRLKTNAFNRLEAYNNIFAIGDTALLTKDPTYPDGHPQVAQVALQQARNLGDNFLKKTEDQWQPFQYSDKGSMAIIGRNKAVTDGPKEKFFINGFLAWCIWIFVHIMSLVNYRNRIRALYDWIGYYFHKDQSFRMIIKPRNVK
ncbi:NAD(P)/FAD-dependent oxidoreductase [Galbibacter pacificus]|uniref:NADH:ubiquinone reductase (non-electrogenic) n=1 Tax=Galbibacter pacificus TaxID=2996052 RepID=A0ABT6FN33_9FLAO|nr:NAD(P)/FAD-dependent oxidoreductase [Galbibacter pacificus]MDG3581006.1 NAD(P)/FAD-dependent oxidoreductase [Galbibacter pacificus]MDG3584484.1 NAD(P)/FAD-dependent oxidoreductase [Galbibacter pacificus]